MREPIDNYPKNLVWLLFYTVGLVMYLANGLCVAFQDFLAERDAIKAHYRAREKN